MKHSAPPTPPALKNPGPSWGYRFMCIADRLLPEALYRPVRALGTWVAMVWMPEQRRCSREYLEIVLERPPTWREVFRHFFAFEEMLMTKLRVANGQPYGTVYGPGSDDFRHWLENGGPVLLGTFHVGVSDLQGCQLGDFGPQSIYLVRQRVGNSLDTEKLAARSGGRLQFIWVNEPQEILWALKEAAATPAAIALQCDRVEFSARTETFEFLGARRRFPFAIYHLALIFGRPVLLSVGVPQGPAHAVLHPSPRFALRPGETREAALARARAHFQDFLFLVEGLLRKDPYQWFNFIPLSPPVEAPAAPSP